MKMKKSIPSTERILWSGDNNGMKKEEMTVVQVLGDALVVLGIQIFDLLALAGIELILLGSILFVYSAIKLIKIISNTKEYVLTDKAVYVFEGKQKKPIRLTENEVSRLEKKSDAIVIHKTDGWPIVLLCAVDIKKTFNLFCRTLGKVENSQSPSEPVEHKQRYCDSADEMPVFNTVTGYQPNRTELIELDAEMFQNSELKEENNVVFVEKEW